MKNTQKTIYSLLEYKALDKIVKRAFPKHELALFWMDMTNSIQLVAAPKYHGYKPSIDMPNDQTSEVYTFDVGKFMYPFENTFPDAFHLIQGLNLAHSCSKLIYFHNSPFKYWRQLFVELFKTAVTGSHHMFSNRECRFKRYGMLRPNEDPFVSNDDPYACIRMKHGSDFTVEEFIIENDLAYDSKVNKTLSL